MWGKILENTIKVDVQGKWILDTIIKMDIRGGYLIESIVNQDIGKTVGKGRVPSTGLSDMANCEKVPGKAVRVQKVILESKRMYIAIGTFEIYEHHPKLFT